MGDVVAKQIPAFERINRSGKASYDIGCLYIGVNDVRSVDWDRPGYEADFASALGFLAARSERTLALTAPLDLGRPRAGEKVRELNESIKRVAAERGTIVVDLSDFGARNQVMTDHVHPTAFGQIAIAERALAALERDGVGVRVWPSSLIEFETTHWKRLRGDLTYLYRHAKVSVRAGVVGAGARVLGARAGGLGAGALGARAGVLGGGAGALVSARES